MSETMPKPAEPVRTKKRWYKRTPSVKRFIFWNILCWAFGVAALVGGVIYTEAIVKPIAETGSNSFGPMDLFKKEEAGKRVFGTSDRLNILILGIDYNYNDQGILYTKGARSDTILVMSLSREAKFLNLVSIPRDTQVLIADDIGYDKINSAYSYGNIEQARETVSNFLGIPIHHHVILKVSGAKEVVNALGGLPIDVEKNMDYDDNWGKLHIHLKKGPQVLDGEQAVGYARFRMDEEGDRGRIRRQQQVVRALGQKLKEPAMLSRVDELARVVKQNLDTDLNLFQMVDLANLYSSFNFSKMRSAAIVGDDAMDANGISYIVPYEPENRRTVRRLLQNLDWLDKDDLRIRVFYKKAPSYLAYDLADRLYDSGFRGIQVEAIGYADQVDTSQTRLVWYSDVPRLKGVIANVVGKRPMTSDTVPVGRDDDLAIYIGDNEEEPGRPCPTVRLPLIAPLSSLQLRIDRTPGISPNSSLAVCLPQPRTTARPTRRTNLSQSLKLSSSRWNPSTRPPTTTESIRILLLHRLKNCPLRQNPHRLQHRPTRLRRVRLRSTSALPSLPQPRSIRVGFKARAFRSTPELSLLDGDQNDWSGHRECVRGRLGRDRSSGEDLE